MNDSRYLGHLLDADRNRALMARILINATNSHLQCPVDISELRQLSDNNRIETDAYLTWRYWNRSLRFHCNEEMIAIAEA